METTRIKLAALWMVVMFSIVMADIIGFIHPSTLQGIIFATLELASMIAVPWYVWRQFGKTELVHRPSPQTVKNVLRVGNGFSSMIKP